MSRIGKNPVVIPNDVKIDLKDNYVSANGNLGTLTRNFPAKVKLIHDADKISVIPIDETKKAREAWGLSRSLLQNMVTGVSSGFKRNLEIFGVGYRAIVKGNILTLFLGYSHDINFLIPNDIKINCPKPTSVEIFGVDKERVGLIASKIRSLRPPEPYKGKGVRYDDEVIIRKEGKKK